MKITCYGEVLWDVFPTHKTIGGAPFNVALRLKSMGVDSKMITRIGNDSLGQDIIDYALDQGISSQTFQVDNTYVTGQVNVLLDSNNTATYEISSPVAWDFIECSDEVLSEVVQSEALIYGSLASRNEKSKRTLFRLLDKATFKVMDANLRPPHYDVEVLSELMNKADFIKLNEEELEEVCSVFNIHQKGIENQIIAISEYTDTSKICITKGGEGATLFYNGSFYHNSGYKVKVVDTVGAGDSFLATLICKLLKESEPEKSLNYACAIGAMVAGNKGANPVFSNTEIQDFITSQR